MKRSAILLALLVFCVAMTACSKPAMDMEPSGYNAKQEDAWYSSMSPAIEDNLIDEYGTKVDNPEQGTATVADGRKLIRNVYLSAETKEFDEQLSELSAKVKGLGGYFEQYQISDAKSSRYRSANLIIRLPKDQVDAFLASFSGSVHILRQEENMKDVTLSYTDTASHLSALRKEEARLLELMDEAKTLQDLIVIEDKLSNIRYQIERYESTIRSFDNQIDYSTVSIYLTEVEKETPVTKPTLGSRIAERFRSSMEDLKEFGEDFVVWLVGALPALIIFGLIVLVIVLIIRRSVAKKKEARARAARALAEQNGTDR